MAKLTQRTKNFLDQIEGFVVSFNQVSREGFFGDIAATVDWRERAGNTIKISATGFIAVNDKFREEGVTPFIEPETILASVRDKLDQGKFSLTCVRCEVKTTDWPKLDKLGDKCIGKLGLQLQFDLILYLKPRGSAKLK